MSNNLQPWYWRSLPLESRTGSQVFDCLFRNTGAIGTLLESPYPTPQDPSNRVDAYQLARYSICAGMPRSQQGCLQMWTPSVGEILPFLHDLLSAQVGIDPRKWRDQADVAPPSHLPFTGGWLGWLGYDLAWEIEQLPYTKPDSLSFPVAFWYEPAAFAVLDHSHQILWLAATDEAELDHLQERLEQSSPCPPVPLSLCSSIPLSFLTSQSDYEAAVIQAKKYIRAGDIFQANLSLRFKTTTSAESWAIYRALQHINPSPFASYWQTPWGDVISCSPERLVELHGRQAQTRPIAGTRSRGATPVTDQQLEHDLITNTKERAEHIMLVDLERNDLGRVCQWGSVEVNELFTIERYSHVMHLVSNITGTLRADYNAIDLIRALFPGGTITGCPKVRCLEIIEELEPLRRSLFYGSCGYLDHRGNLDLNILIRTLLFSPESPALLTTQDSKLQRAAVWGQVGAGIVADSDPEKEWYESLHKAQAQLVALKVLGS